MKINSIGAADQNDILYLAELNKKLELMPNDYDTLLRKALLLSYPFYRTDEAEKIYELLASMFPQAYDVYFWHGETLYVCDGYYDKAIILLRKAIQVDKNRAEAYVMLAQVLDMMDDSFQSEMEVLFTEALKIEKYWPNAWDGLINLLIHQKRFVEARQLIDDAFNHIPTDYVDSDDIIQERLDVYVSGRSRACNEKKVLQNFLKTIEDAENSNAK